MNLLLSPRLMPSMLGKDSTKLSFAHQVHHHDPPLVISIHMFLMPFTAWAVDPRHVPQPRTHARQSGVDMSEVLKRGRNLVIHGANVRLHFPLVI